MRVHGLARVDLVKEEIEEADSYLRTSVPCTYNISGQNKAVSWAKTKISQILNYQKNFVTKKRKLSVSIFQKKNCCPLYRGNLQWKYSRGTEKTVRFRECPLY